MDWQMLKSGSDIRGVAIEAPGLPVVLTESVVSRVAAAFVQWLRFSRGIATGEIRVAVGRDSRISGQMLLRAAAQGLSGQGVQVFDCGLCTTPAMFMTTVSPQTGCQGAIMITASHHPWMRNGMKFFTAQGGLSESDIRMILSLAPRMLPREDGVRQPVRYVDFLRIYSDRLARLMREGLGDMERPLEGLKVAVDAGNGAGGFYARLLESLGADVGGSVCLEPDGRFPIHVPNPEEEEAMAYAGRAVREAAADIGVVFDADCDRAAVVNDRGEAVNRDRLIALSANLVLEGDMGGAIVTDSVTAPALTDYIARLGGAHIRYMRGYRNVIDEAVRLNAEGVYCPLAIETSGHAALKENYFLDDGMYLVTRILIFAMGEKRAGRKFDAGLAALPLPLEEREVRLRVDASDFREAGQEALDALEERARSRPDMQVSDDSREGVRILFELDGVPGAAWCVARMSVHDPTMPIYVQAYVPGGVQRAFAILAALLNHPALNTKPLARLGAAEE